MSGVIVRYEQKKGYGFVRPDRYNEDLFFLKAELPEDLRDIAEEHPEEVRDQRVLFEVRIMPDGKIRALGLARTDAADLHNRGDDPVPPPPEDLDAPMESGDLDDGLADEPPSRSAPLPDLAAKLVHEMQDFLSKNNGRYDLGNFTRKFRGVKRKQLEKYFDVELTTNGSGHIKLR